MKTLLLALVVLSLICLTYPAVCWSCIEPMRFPSTTASVAEPPDMHTSEYSAVLSGCINALPSDLALSKFIALEPSGHLTLAIAPALPNSFPHLIDPPPRA